jgi:hypothetical protein
MIRNPSELAPKRPYIIDIYEISINALYYQIKRLSIEFFQTSLYEINRILDDRDDL